MSLSPLRRLGRSLGLLSLLAFSGLPALAAEPPAAGQVDMKAMMERAKQFTQPGDHHKFLAKYIGTWDTETRFPGMPGAGAADKGTLTAKWLMEGRWVQSELTGTFLGMPIRSVMTLGYDNFKMSYVTAAVSNIDTALTTSEGDLDPGGKVLITYGTLDEYLTGEHDKMVKYVWRFVSDDEIHFEVHDLPIGEKNTQVVDIRLKRRKS